MQQRRLPDFHEAQVTLRLQHEKDKPQAATRIESVNKVFTNYDPKSASGSSSKLAMLFSEN